MKKNDKNGVDRRRSRRPPLAAIALLVGFLAVILVLVTLRHQKAGRNHRLRLLAGFGERVEEIVPERAERFVSILRDQPGREEVEAYVAEVTSFEILGDLPSNYSRGYRGETALELVPRGSEIYLTYRGPLYLGPKRAGGSVTARIDLAEVLEPVITPEVFDAILIADRDGRVLFQQGEREVRMASLTGLLARVVPGGEGDGGGDDREEGAPRGRPGDGIRSAAFEHQLGGTHYEVFLQPIAIRMPAVGGRRPDEPIHWVACGLIGRDRLLSSSFTTSPVMLFLLVALFPAALVAWPFLKLWLISPRQRFSRFDVVSLVFAGLLGISLVTLTFADFLFISRIKSTIDGQLEGLSSGLRASLRDEIFDAHAQLMAHLAADAESAEDRELLRAELRRPGAKGIDWLEDLHQKLGTRTTRARYPYFHSIAWIDGEGDQAVKLPMVASAVPINNVERRAYFRSIAVELLSVPGRDRVGFPDRSAHRFRMHRGGYLKPIELCLQPIRSLTTGEDLLVLSAQAPNGQFAAGGQGLADLPVAALVTRPLSLAHPLLPRGFGFALLDQSGRVLFHSDSRRSQNENFLKSSDRRSLLAALLRERRSASVDLTYWGRRHRAHVAPFEELPWSLVTFRDMRDLRSRNFELVYDFLNVYVPYLLLFGLLAAFLIGMPRRFGRYLWPGAAFAPAYGRTILFGIFLTGCFALLLQTGGRDAVFWGSLAVPFVMLFGTGLLLRFGWCRLPDPDRPGAPAPPPAHRQSDWFAVLALLVVCLLPVRAALALGPLRPLPAFLVVAALAGAWFRIQRYHNFVGRQRRIGYVGALTTVFFVVAVLPALGIVQLASGRQAQFLIQDSQVALVDAIESRRDALHDFRWLDTDGSGDPGGAGPRAGGFYAGYDDELERFEGRYLESFGTVAAAGDGGAPPDWPYPCGSGPGRGGVVPRWMAARLMPLNDLSSQPVGIDLSRYPRHGCEWTITPGAGGDGRRLAGRFDSLWQEGELVLATAPIPLEGWTGLGFARWLLLGLGALVVIVLPWGVAWFIGRQALLITLVQTGRLGTIDAILRDIEPGDRAGSDAGAESRDGTKCMLVTSVPDLAVRNVADSSDRFEKVRFADLVKAEKEGKPREFGPEKVVLVIGFKPELYGTEDAEEQIAALQNLTDCASRSVVLVSRLSMTALQEELVEADERAETPDPRVIRRWAAYLATFVMRYGRDAGDRAGFARRLQEARREALERARRRPNGVDGPRAQFEQSMLSLLLEECRLTRQLQAVGRQILGEMRAGDWEAATEEQVLGQISYLARPYYQAIWAGCSTDEKVVLAQLALDGLVNPNNRVWALDLMQKGLIVRNEVASDARRRIGWTRLLRRLRVTRPVRWLRRRSGLVARCTDPLAKGCPPDPSLRLMNRSFADFVRQVVDRTRLLQWEEEKGTSTWSVLKWLLPLPLLLLGVFLFLTQRDAVSNAVGALVALASLVPTLLNIYGHFREVTARRDLEHSGRAAG